MFDEFKPSEESIILNSKLETLYNHDFGNGQYFKVIFSDKDEVHIKVAARTVMQIVYIKEKDEIRGFDIIKVVSGQKTQKLKFNNFGLQQLKTFLSLIAELNLKDITERKLDILDHETKQKIAPLLTGKGGGDLIIELLTNGTITNQDIVNTGYRKNQLDIFRNLLLDDYLSEYKETIGKPQTKDETAWQHFFMSNQWIFGYGLDYRFQGVLQKEFHASNTDASGGSGVIGDFLTGDKKFTTFVELKTPTTELFSGTNTRSMAWKLSIKLMEAFSQILEQKASGQIKIETTKKLYDGEGEVIKQNSYDSKVILIIGNWNQINKDDPATQEMKRKTFELFRRDSRNVEIITYDELFDRASFIADYKYME